MNIEKLKDLPETTPYKIVAMCVYNNSLIVATEYHCYIYDEKIACFIPIEFSVIPIGE